LVWASNGTTNAVTGEEGVARSTNSERLSPSAAGRVLGLTSQWVRNAIRREWIPAVRIDRDFLIDRAVVDGIAAQVDRHGLRKWTIAADVVVTDLSKWGTADEVANRIGTSRAGVVTAVRAGRLAAVKGSRGFLIRWTDVVTFWDGGQPRRVGRRARQGSRPASGPRPALFRLTPAQHYTPGVYNTIAPYLSLNKSLDESQTDFAERPFAL